MILAIILATAGVNILLGIITYKKNPDSATHKLLSILTVIFALWAIANYFSLNSSTEEGTLFWIRTVMCITAPMGPILYLFIKAYPHQQLRINKILLSIIVVITLLLQFIAYTPLLFSSVSLENGITPTPGPAIALYGLLLIGFPIAGFVEIIKKYKNSSGIEKLQLKYLVFGIFVTFTLLILTNFIAVLLFNFSGFVVFGPIFSLILVGFIFYAILRHRLLDIRLIVARSISYTLLLITLGVFYTGGIFFISNFLLEGEIDTFQTLTYAVLVFFLALSFEPLKNFFASITDKVFFKSKYATNELVFNLTQIIASTYSLNELTRKSLKQLLTSVRIYRGVFIVYSKTDEPSVIHEGYNHPPKFDKNIINKLKGPRRMTLFDEVKQESVKELMRSLNITIILPLLERNEKVGILLLGDKKSGEIYSHQDIEVLRIFGPEISVAIQNAKSYAEIRKFNTRLREEVDNATKNLKNANERLKDLDRLKDDFVGIASHELKTPLTSIKAYAQLLRNRFWQLKDTDASELLERMDLQLNKLSSLINDLLDITKIEKGKLQFHLGFFSMNDLLEETIEEMQRITERHQIVQEAGDNITVYADRERIGQVLTNLISNAIKYSPNQNKIVVNTEADNNHVTVSVQDFGIGMSKEDQVRVFDRFFRSESRKKNTYPGLGLGLFISSEIVKRHNGKIWVKSEKGKGSRFSFSIPVQQMN